MNLLAFRTISPHAVDKGAASRRVKVGGSVEGFGAA